MNAPDQAIESVKRLMNAIIKLHPNIAIDIPEQEECYLAYHECREAVQSLESYLSTSEVKIKKLEEELEKLRGHLRETVERTTNL